jgi:hypothetical protein
MWRDELQKPINRELMQQYLKWLVDTGRVQHGRPADNMANKAMFNNWLEKREALSRRASGDAS